MPSRYLSFLISMPNNKCASLNYTSECCNFKETQLLAGKFYGPIFPLPTCICSVNFVKWRLKNSKLCVVCVLLCGNKSCRAAARINCSLRCSSALTRRAFLLTIIVRAAWRKVEKQQPLIVRVTKNDPVVRRRIGTRRRPFVMRCGDKNAFNLAAQRN